MNVAWQFEDIFRSSAPDLSERLLSSISSNLGANCVLGLSAALSTRCAHPQSIDTTIRSLVQVLPRTADIMVHNDYGNASQAPRVFQTPHTFQDAFKKTVTRMLHNDLQKVYLFRSEQTADILPILVSALSILQVPSSMGSWTRILFMILRDTGFSSLLSRSRMTVGSSQRLGHSCS